MLLDNGVRLVLDRFAAPTAAVVVGVGVGSLFEERGRRGITHLLEHMLFRVPGFDVDEAVESLGGSNNAYTERDVLLLVLEGVSESAAGLVELAFRLYANERFDEADLERERDVVLSELRQVREDPSDWVGELGVRALFGDSDWGDPVGGTPEAVESISLGDLLEFKRRWFTPGNTFVVLSGGFGEEAVAKAVELFGGLEGEAPPRPRPTAGSGPGRIVERREVDGVYYARAVRVAVGDPAAAFAALHGAAFHLESGTKSVLFNLLRTPGIAYSYYVDYDVVGDVAYLEVVVESARSLEEARRAVSEALKPRSPPPYRLRYFDYVWRVAWRSPANRAVSIGEYVAKGGRPEDAEAAFRRAAEGGTLWVTPLAEAEAVVGPEELI
ncbi:M16 family metallopeptidase [Pyrobaculum neutrophilum]|uniref:M16 family metallopeptidase n=1 Tax=Pyrobaculum neutrophilum TaxID=70771 RepID=UPI0011E558CE|nr:pitrilysin family protein [Pyrobaculum neutrophilum]